VDLIWNNLIDIFSKCSKESQSYLLNEIHLRLLGDSASGMEEFLNCAIEVNCHTITPFML